MRHACQSDDVCWADTINTCQGLLEDFAALEPNKLLKAVYDELDEAGMLRSGDDDRYQMLDAWFTSRLAAMPDELLTYTDPNGVYCTFPEVDCGGYCVYYEYCQQCIPPKGPGPAPLPGAAGAPDDGGIAGTAAVAGSFGMGGAPGGGAGGMVGIGGDIVMAGAGGIPECPKIENYGIAR